VVNTTVTVCATSKTFLWKQFFQSPCDAKDSEKTITSKHHSTKITSEFIYRQEVQRLRIEEGSPTCLRDDAQTVRLQASRCHGRRPGLHPQPPRRALAPLALERPGGPSSENTSACAPPLPPPGHDHPPPVGRRRPPPARTSWLQQSQRAEARRRPPVPRA
jgi:hypothetical protein